MRHRRRFGEDAQPAEWEHPLELASAGPSGIVSRDTPWKPSHPATMSAVELVRHAVLAPGDTGRAGDVVQRDVLGFVDDRGAGGVLRGVEVLGDLGLAVDHHGPLAALGKIDPELVVAVAEGDTVVHLALCVHSLAHPGAPQRLHRIPFEDPGADAREHVRAAAALEDHRVDAGIHQELRQQKAGRPPADDDHLCFH